MVRKQKAFTLVELLVAMAIIGVLLGLAIFGINSALQAQRDTERKTALQDISLGIQKYNETYGAYPASITFAATGVTMTDGLSNPVNKVSVPLSGAAKSEGTNQCDVLNSESPKTTSAVTCYAVDMTTEGGDFATGGIAVCALLENTSIICVGPGATKGNTFHIASNNTFLIK